MTCLLHTILSCEIVKGALKVGEDNSIRICLRLKRHKNLTTFLRSSIETLLAFHDSKIKTFLALS